MTKDIFLTNSLGNKKEKFVPRDQKKVGMYVCGPTVYDDPHIGNARPIVIFDILFKVYLKIKETLSGGTLSEEIPEFSNFSSFFLKI